MQRWEWTLIFLRCVGGGGGGECREEGGIKYLYAHTLPLRRGNRSVSFHLLSLLCTRSIQHAFHFEELKSSVLKHSLLFERLMVKVGDTW